MERKELKKVVKSVRVVRKNHKLYVREQGGTLRRLDKISFALYAEVITLFFKGEGEKLYAKKNKDADHWTKLKPIFMPLDKDKFSNDFNYLKKQLKRPHAKSITVYYNGSWKPLVSMEIFKTLVNTKKSK